MNQEELEKKYGISLDKKDIRKRTIRDMVLLLIAGSIYYLVIIHTPFSLKCYLYELFHIKCPSCGVTRMCVSMIHFDFMHAFRYNPFICITFPYVIYEIIYLLHLNESKKKQSKINRVILYIWLVLFIIFGILRNIFNW